MKCVIYDSDNTAVFSYQKAATTGGVQEGSFTQTYTATNRHDYTIQVSWYAQGVRPDYMNAKIIDENGNVVFSDNRRYVDATSGVTLLIGDYTRTFTVE